MELYGQTVATWLPTPGPGFDSILDHIASIILPLLLSSFDSLFNKTVMLKDPSILTHLYVCVP